MTFDLGDPCPIGVFDSGLGGLSVLREIHQLLPHEDLIYIGDSAHAPYGDKSAEDVRHRSLAIAEFLLDQGVKAIVVACNTATAEAIDDLRMHLDVPVIGMEPAIKPAAQLSKNGVIGVLATQRTINSERLLGLAEQYAKDKKVLAQACPGLVEQVEACELDSNKTRELLNKYITPLLLEGSDALILGCTHYPFLRETIQEITQGLELEILETGKPVALQLQRILKQNHLEKLTVGNTDNLNMLGQLTFYNSSKDPEILMSMQRLWRYSQNSKDSQFCSSNPIAIKALPALEYDHD